MTCSLFPRLKCVFLVTGPSHWGGICKTGKKQSPINIKSNDATVDKGLGSFILKNYDMAPTNGTFTAKNNGHSLVFVFPENADYGVSGGGLVGNYKTHSFHFHWGSVNTQGPEHILDGEKFGAEVSEGRLWDYLFIHTYWARHTLEVGIRRPEIALGETGHHLEALGCLGLFSATKKMTYVVFFKNTCA